jgi:hypothetical protein
MADCNAPSTISNLASKDTQRIVGTIAENLAANSPFINLLKGGTFPSGTSDEQRSIVEMQAAGGYSLVNPEFTNDTAVCGTVGNQTLTGTVQYLYRLKTLRGRGPRVCVKQGYSAFKGSYIQAENAIKDDVTQIINSDIRYQLLVNSASKFVAVPGQPFTTLFTGGSQSNIGIGFVDIEPTGSMTMAALQKLNRFVRDTLLAKPFGGASGYSRVIASSDQIDAWREETGTKEVLLSSQTGGFKLGESVLTGYQWEQFAQYRGLSFGVDQRPLRATSINSDGTLNYVNPYVTVVDSGTNTAYDDLNPGWLSAPLEVGFLVFEDTFLRLVPERYVGEGSFKFSPQLAMGELEWFYQRDNDCNVWGDYGQHIYQISRAYKPIRPQHIVPFVYHRCEAAMNLTACP